MSRSCLRRIGTNVLGLAVLAGLMLSASGEAVAQGKKSETVVKTTASAGKIGADGKQDVTVTLTMTSPYYVYANPVGLAGLVDAQTTVTVAAKAKLADVKIIYPTPVEVKDKVVGNYKVYKNKAVIRAVVQRVAGDTSPLEVKVAFMSCNGKTCLLPSEVKLSVP